MHPPNRINLKKILQVDSASSSTTISDSESEETNQESKSNSTGQNKNSLTQSHTNNATKMPNEKQICEKEINKATSSSSSDSPSNNVQPNIEKTIRQKEKLMLDPHLNDNDILIFMEKLKLRFPNIKGMEDPIILSHQPELVEKSIEFYRILFSRSNHWILVAGGINSDQESLSVFDSLYGEEIEENLGQVISKFVYPTVLQSGFLKFVIKRVQKQKGNYCGYIALANLTALCFGLDPETILYDEDRLREHYIKIIFDLEPLSMFPHTSKRKTRLQNRILTFEI